MPAARATLALPVACLAAGLAVSAAPDARAMSVTALYQAHLVIDVADLRADQVITATGFKAGARLTTLGALGVLKPQSILAQADGGVAHGAPAPAVYIQTQRNKRRVIHFTPGGGPRSLADPLTQVLRAALQPGAASPCLGAVPVFDGRQRYDLVLSPAGGAALEGAAAHMGFTRSVACRMGFHPIAGFSGGAPKKNPFVRADPVATFAFEPHAGVWVLADVAVPTLVGSGHISLTSLHIDGARPAFTAPPAPAKPASARTKPSRH
jgi:hypothetical protein